MKSNYLEICRLLASSGYSLNRISEFLELVDRQGPGMTMRDIEDMRRETNNWMTSVDLDVPRGNFYYELNDTAQKIERLLIDDAGMPKTLAINILSNELINKYPGLAIPHEGRKGFSAWVRRVASLVPEKELLYIATNIRNRTVHDLPSDWRLK